MQECGQTLLSWNMRLDNWSQVPPGRSRWTLETVNKRLHSGKMASQSANVPVFILIIFSQLRAFRPCLSFWRHFFFSDAILEVKAPLWPHLNVEIIPDQKFTRRDRYHNNPKARLHGGQTYFTLRMLPWTILVRSQIMMLWTDLTVRLSCAVIHLGRRMRGETQRRPYRAGPVIQEESEPKLNGDSQLIALCTMPR